MNTKAANGQRQSGMPSSLPPPCHEPSGVSCLPSDAPWDNIAGVLSTHPSDTPFVRPSAAGHPALDRRPGRGGYVMAFRVAFLLLLIGAAASAAPQSAAPRTTDDQDVRAIVDRYVGARERRDEAAIAALFTADADQFTTGGEWRRGRDAVVPAASPPPSRPVARGGSRSAPSAFSGGTWRSPTVCTSWPALATAPPDGCGRRSS